MDIIFSVFYKYYITRSCYVAYILATIKYCRQQKWNDKLSVANTGTTQVGLGLPQQHLPFLK